MITYLFSSEGHDRTDIGLPGKQDQLLQAIKGAIAKTTPMIVVLMSGGPVDITTAKVYVYFIKVSVQFAWGQG